jgi:ABC-type dipeptide/oligopeptide/nickel transport system permease component
MSKLVQWAVIANTLGFLLAIPRLLNTTPITMVVFFLVSMPRFGVGLLLYLAAVLLDLRSHEVLIESVVPRKTAVRSYLR